VNRYLFLEFNICNLYSSVLANRQTGWEEWHWNYLFCVKRNVKPQPNSIWNLWANGLNQVSWSTTIFLNRPLCAGINDTRMVYRLDAFCPTVFMHRKQSISKTHVWTQHFNIQIILTTTVYFGHCFCPQLRLLKCSEGLYVTVWVWLLFFFLLCCAIVYIIQYVCLTALFDKYICVDILRWERYILLTRTPTG